jgi:type IV pilus assembly protein PilC
MFKDFFAADEIELVRASEGMGNMPDALMNIAAELENFQKIKSKVKSAMTYPITMLVFALGAVAILLVKVIPTFVGLFAGHELPAITQFMLTLSAYLQANRWWMLSLVIGTVVTVQSLYAYFLPFKILIDGVMLKIPAVKGVVKTFYLYRLSKLLSDFYKAGVNPVVALEQISAIFENYHYKKKMLDIRTDLEA